MRAPYGVRAHWICPDCGWRIAWDYDGQGGDPDMGLVIAAHVQDHHRGWINDPAPSWRQSVAAKLRT